MKGVPAVAAALAVALLAACTDGQDSACLESNATPYSFFLNGDSTLVFHWPAAYLPVRVYAEPTGELPANVDAAMVLWVNATRCGEITMQRVTDSTLADIIFRNPAALPPLPVAGVTLAADSVGACTGRTDGLLDSTSTLTGPLRSYVAPSSSDPVAVAACYHFTVAHELGHGLGLFAHSANTADLMYVVPRRPVVSVNDRFTLQRLYRTALTILPPPR